MKKVKVHLETKETLHAFDISIPLFKDKMEQISSSSVRDTLPPLSSKYPWLISQNLEDGDPNTEYQFFCTIHNELPHYQCQIPELRAKRFRGCFHGWVILSGHPHNVECWSLWNPTTSKIILLPTLKLKDEEEYESIGECCLSAPPTDPSSILLLTRTDVSTFLFCRVNGKRNKSNWTEMSYAKQLKKLTKDGDLLNCLTCCNGKVYALSTGGTVAKFIMHIDIVVTDKEVETKLMMFGVTPHSSMNHHGLITCHYGVNTLEYLTSSSTELFYIEILLQRDTRNVPSNVYVFKSDMTCVNWEERECIKRLDLTDYTVDEVALHDGEVWDLSCKTWEEVDDVKDRIFFLDLAHDLVSSTCVISSELGGYVHILSEMGDIIYSYHVKTNTITVFPIPSPMLPTSYASIWEFRMEDDKGEAKCIVDVEMEKNDEVLLRSGTDDGIEYTESHLLNVPFHILETIMEHAVGVEYMNFRATCKKCHLAAPLRNWKNNTSSGRLRTESVISPWLMVIGKGGLFTFTDPVLRDTYSMKTSQVPQIAANEFNRLFCLRFGWLLFDSRDLRSLVLFNPFTKDICKFDEDYYRFWYLCFSAPPTSPDCMVVGLEKQGNDWHVDINFINRKPRSWDTFPLGPIPHTICFLSFVGQNLYGLCLEGEIIVFNNLGKEGCAWKLVEAKSPKSCCQSLTQTFLAGNDEHLFLVRVCANGEHVEVFKLNDSEQDWKKVDSLGKHTIYICGTSCLCIEAKTPQLQNKIFFPRLHIKTGKIVFYSLDTHMYHTWGDESQEHLTDFVGTTYLLSPHVWIEPSWF